MNLNLLFHLQLQQDLVLDGLGFVESETDLKYVLQQIKIIHFMPNVCTNESVPILGIDVLGTCLLFELSE